jgi:hypothetical protein
MDLSSFCFLRIPEFIFSIRSSSYTFTIALRDRFPRGNGSSNSECALSSTLESLDSSDIQLP